MSTRCPNCGFVTFSSAEKCKRCESTLAAAPVGYQDAASSAQRKSTASSVKLLLTALAVAVVGCGGFLSWAMWQDAQQRQAEAEQAEGRRRIEAAVRAKNVEAGRKAVEQLRRLQSAAEGGISYSNYGELVTATKVETDSALREFTPLDESDRSFALEVKLAVLKYISARESWYGAIRYSDVVSESERDNRVNKHWSEAIGHTDNAERMIGSMASGAITRR